MSGKGGQEVRQVYNQVRVKVDCKEVKKIDKGRTREISVRRLTGKAFMPGRSVG